MGVPSPEARAVSVHKRETGSWQVRWNEGNKQRSKGGFRTKAEAVEWEQANKRRLNNHAFGEVTPSDRRLDDYIPEWFDKSKDGRWSASTAEGYRYLINKWIIPHVGGWPLSQFGTKAVRDWQFAIVKDGATNDQANKALRVMSSALTDAVLDELIPSNPVDRVKPLPHQRSERAVLNVEQVESLLSEMGRRDRILTTLMFYCGLRPSEAHAVRGEDIRGDELHVSRSFVLSQVKETKTLHVRRVHLCEPVAEDLSGLEDGWVAPNRYGKPVLPANWRGRNFAPALEAAGLDHLGVTPYSGRHTFASLLIWQGEPVQHVAAQMGDHVQTVLKHYTHIVDRARGETPKPMADAIMEARNV